MAQILKLSTEILDKILSFLSAKTLLNVSETCKTLKDFVLESDSLWRNLCFEDFIVFLKVKGSFPSFFAIYQALYKYDIVQRQVYEDKCQLTFHCDVFNLPDYLYHWCTLLCQYSMHWPLSRTILMKDKFKKMWGLKDADLEVLPPNGSGKHGLRSGLLAMAPICDYHGEKGFHWGDGLDASIHKHGHIKDFHEFALNRCKKSLKRIEKKYTTAARTLRVGRVFKLLNAKEYKKIKNLVIRERGYLSAEIYFDEEPDDEDEDLPIYLRSRTPSTANDPRRIGVDYVRGLLHKTGFQQLVNFSDFCNNLMEEAEALPQLTEEDVKQCTQFVYEKLSHKATEKLFSPEEFMECARIYQQRIDKVWEWQCEKGQSHRKMYRSRQAVKSHQHYKSYVREGKASELAALKTYFEGTEKLKKWLNENTWIQDLIKPEILDIARGCLSEEMPDDPEERAMHERVLQYLTSGKTADFNKILLKLKEISKRYVEGHRENIKKLEESISVPVRLKTRKRK